MYCYHGGAPGHYSSGALDGKPRSFGFEWYAFYLIGELLLIFALGGADQVVRMWDTRSGVQVSTAFAKASVASLELSRDCKYITTAAGKEVTFWDATTLVPYKMYTLSILHFLSTQL